MTFICNEAEDETSSSIALDFSHKIRQYFSGNSDECQIPNLLLRDNNMDDDHNA